MGTPEASSGEPSTSGREISRRGVLGAGVLGAVTSGLIAGCTTSRVHAGAVHVHAGGIRDERVITKGPVPREAPDYDFNHGWLFGGEYFPGAELPGLDDGGFEHITLPHTAVPLSWRDWDYTWWERRWIYRKHFRGDVLIRDRTPSGAGTPGGIRVLASFDGAATNTTVVLNGATLGTHRGGYLPWQADLTPHLTRGGNVLAVIVDARWLNVPPDALPRGPRSIDYLQPGGIYRDVTVRVVPEIYLSDVFVRPVDVLSRDRAVAVEATVDAGVVPEGKAVTITATLWDGTRALASTRAYAPLARPGTHVIPLTIRDIGPVTYWSPENPRLYTVTTTLDYTAALPGESGPADRTGTADRTGAAARTHTVTTRTGFRSAVFTRDGFYLNGARREIFGLNRHQLYPYLGMAAPERLQRRDAEILRNEFNCTMVRCSHYPQSPHFLDACDELGLMVWEEPPGWVHMGNAAFRELVLANVRDMVLRDRNRPSVIVWATRLDETRNYPVLYARAREIARQLDPSRQTTGAVTFHRMEEGWAEDVFSYDDYEVAGREPVILPPLPGVPYMISEAVGASLDLAYLWTDSPTVLSRQAFAHALAHEQAQADPRIAGLLGWCGFDYYSVARPARRAWHTIRTPGVADVFRVPKPGAAFYRSQRDPKDGAVIIPAFFWDSGPDNPATGAAPAHEPPGPGSMFATNCERLEIWAGRTHLATARPDREMFPHLAYPPVFADLTLSGRTLPGPVAPGRFAGPVRPARPVQPVLPSPVPDLRVVGYIGARPAATLLMSADTLRDRLQVTADDDAITADGVDTTRITFRATDAYGNHRRGVTGDVTLSLAGPAVLIGNSPFPLGDNGGVGGAFVRSVQRRTGLVTVTASHPVLGSSSVRIAVTTDRSGQSL